MSNDLMNLFKLKLNIKTAQHITSSLNIQLQNKQLGSGRSGITYLTNNNTVVKIGKIPINNNRIQNHKAVEILNHELMITKLAGNINVGPRLYKSDIVVHKEEIYIVLEMEKMDGTLKQLLENKKVSSKIKNKAIEDTLELVKKLHSYNLCHKDLGNLDNVMFKKVDNKYIMRLIDFGDSSKCGSGNQIKNEMNVNKSYRYVNGNRKPFRNIIFLHQ